MMGGRFAFSLSPFAISLFASCLTGKISLRFFRDLCCTPQSWHRRMPGQLTNHGVSLFPVERIRWRC